MRQINSLKHRLDRLREVVEEKYPGNSHLVPSSDEISTIKLNGANIITDTCSSAQKVRRIVCAKVDGLHSFDCMQHIRNVWIGNMEKALTSELNNILRNSLDEIDPKLRVTSSISAIIRAVDKEFSLSANYPKGHGALFAQWMRDYHPGELLLHVERAAGSRQDLCTEGCLPIARNYEYWLEFLDWMLKKTGKDDKASILQRNLFVALGSVEMIALARLLSIIHISVCMPFRWLAGKTHELAEYKWGPMSMARVIDTVREKTAAISKKPELILDEKFMMDIFKTYRNELPPFKTYWEEIFTKKRMAVVARKSGAKVVQFAQIKKDLFKPTRKTDKQARKRMIELASVATDAIVKEIDDESKATYKYTKASKSKFSWAHCPAKTKQDFLSCKATNDEAESTLGGATYQVQRYGRINLASAGAISDARRNAFLYRPVSKKDKQAKGIFHGLHLILRDCIVQVAMQDAPKTRAANNEALELQQLAKQAREELKKEKNMEKATEQFIEALYYYRMYYSEACWKGSVTRVTQGLKKLTSETAKYHALKENIMIRVKGFGWDWAMHAWSKNGKKYTTKVLSDWLKFIITEEKKVSVSTTIPTGPPTSVPKRKEGAILGTQCNFVQTLDRKYFANENDFKKRANQLRLEREARGEGSMYALLQPFDRPDIKELLHRRIDVLSFMKVVVDEETKSVGRWCQGEVVRVYENRSKPTVRVLWDPMPDVGGYEDAKEADQWLLPSKWRKDKDGAWRMDVELDIESNSVRSDTNTEKRIEAESEGECDESESESECDESESEIETSDSEREND